MNCKQTYYRLTPSCKIRATSGAWAHLAHATIPAEKVCNTEKSSAPALQVPWLEQNSALRVTNPRASRPAQILLAACMHGLLAHTATVHHYVAKVLGSALSGACAQTQLKSLFQLPMPRFAAYLATCLLALKPAGTCLDVLTPGRLVCGASAPTAVEQVFAAGH